MVFAASNLCHLSDSIIAVKEFLDRWSEYNHDQYCLAILFTYRDFDSGVLGLAWVASVDGTLFC